MQDIRFSESTRTGPRARRSPILVAAGVVLVAVGALTSAGIYTNLSNSQSVIAVIAPIVRGQQITRADLTTVQIGFDPIVKPISSSEVLSIVGQYAKVDLLPGTLLTPQAVGRQPTPGPGEIEIGVSLKAGEYPDTGLRSGDKVELLPIPDRSNPGLLSTGFQGTISTITTSNGTLIASVILQETDARAAAVLSASNKLALILVSRG